VSRRLCFASQSSFSCCYGTKELITGCHKRRLPLKKLNSEKSVCILYGMVRKMVAFRIVSANFACTLLALFVLDSSSIKRSFLFKDGVISGSGETAKNLSLDFSSCVLEDRVVNSQKYFLIAKGICVYPLLSFIDFSSFEIFLTCNFLHYKDIHS